MLKYELIPEQLIHEGIITKSNLLAPEKIAEEIILLTHTSEYWHRLRDLQLTAAEERRTGFKLSPRLIEREMRIAQGTIETSLSAMRDRVGFNIAGGTHHAGSDWAEGFCLLNDQAIAANYLLNGSLAKRILIIDLDVHQGNGTAEIFKDEPKVFTMSVHGQNNFPFRKEISDLDIGLSDGTGDEEYLELLAVNLETTFRNYLPDFVFYLAGVDVLATDKLGKMALSIPACNERDRMVFETCIRYNAPVQVSMGGGYSPGIREIVQAHCNTFKTAVHLYC